MSCNEDRTKGRTHCATCTTRPIIHIPHCQLQTGPAPALLTAAYRSSTSHGVTLEPPGWSVGLRRYKPNFSLRITPQGAHVRADIEVPSLPVDVDSWGRLACYPRGSFCPLSHGPSTRDRGITKPDFRLCSSCRTRSQAPLCLYTLRLVSIQPEGTFGRLRYLLGGDRPSQTAHLALSPRRITAAG